MRQRRFDEAADVLKKALALAEKLNDKSGCAVALHRLGAVEVLRKNQAEGCRCFKRSLELFTGLGDEDNAKTVTETMTNCGCS